MSVAFGASGAYTYSTANGTSITPAHPTGVTAGQKLVLFIHMKPSTANSGSVTTPSGWTFVGSIIGAGGYGSTLGVDTGNTNIFVYEKTAIGTESGTGLVVSIATNNESAARIIRLTKTLGAWATTAYATGSRTTAPTTPLSVATGNIDIASGDFVLSLFGTPTDVTTPNQYSAETFTHSGTTFGTVTELGEWDTSTGNDLGGVATYAQATAGSGTGAFTFGATLAGTLTNVRGPLLVARFRDEAVADLVVQGAAHSQAAESLTLTEILNFALVPQNAAHAQAAENVLLTQQHVLVVAPAAHAQAAGNITLVQQHTLVVQGAAHAQTAEGLGTLPQFTQATPDNANHAQTAGSPTLTQVHNLTVAGALQAQTAGNVTLTQVHVLTVQGAAHAQTAANVPITKQSDLVVQNAVHAQTAESPWLTPGGVSNISAVHPGAHAQFADNVVLEQVITMTGLADAHHAQTATSPVLEHVEFIAEVYSTFHGQKTGHVTLVQESTLQVEDCFHYHEAHPIRLSQFAVAHLFVTPTVPSIVFTDERLVSYLRPPGGVTLLLDGGIVTEVQYPTQDQVEAVDVAYIGGHQYTVTEEEAQVLRDAGYTANLYETVVEV